MPGYQEILIISAIVVGVIFIPRIMESQRKTAPKLIRVRRPLSGQWRLAIAMSIVYPLVAAAALQPWRKNPTVFGLIGLGPVFLGWLLYWVLQGFKRK
jgi:hypothetical protein